MSALLGLAAGLGRRARQHHAAAEALLRAAVASRWMSSYPDHTVVGMPALSPTMTAGNLAKWHIKVGDEISSGTLLADIETDKATMAFENQDDGYVAKLLVADGASNLSVGAPLLVVVEEAKDVAAFADFTASAPPSAGGAAATATASSPAAPAPSTAAPPPPAPSKGPVNHRIGPAARLLLEEAGLSASDITPTGPHNIVTKGDVLAAIAAGVKPAARPAAAAAVPAAAVAPPPPPPAAAPAPPKPASSSGKAPAFTDIPTTQIRKVIASRLLESKVTIPALYGAVDVRLDALATLRKQLAAQGVKLSVNDFVLKAVAMALQEVPDANRLWDGKAQEAVPAPGVDVSVAVATDRGLITPIVKAANAKTVAQISSEVKSLAAKAKANKLKPEEFQGGSFTVSNLGMFGVSYFSAIINPPQGAILAVGGAQQVVRLEGGKPAAHSMMTATLSADHRMYDGELLGSFLGAFKKHIEAPVNLLV